MNEQKKTVISMSCKNEQNSLATEADILATLSNHLATLRLELVKGLSNSRLNPKIELLINKTCKCFRCTRVLTGCARVLKGFASVSSGYTRVLSVFVRGITSIQYLLFLCQTQI